MHIYKQYALDLVEKGHAFYCFATSEELDQMRAEQQARGETPKYDGRGLKLSAEEVQSRLAAGEPHVIRMKVPEEGICTVNDLLRGEVEIPWAQVDMQVLLKTDGLPTYHLANVVDDHLMQITHVFRGEEWLPSAPKHQLLYQYFGWEMPVLGHMPLLRNPDKSKLSKRKNPTSINYYKNIGVLPEALLNYLGRMGWSMPDEREKFTLAEMIEHFDIQRVSLGGPIFDVEKLNWLNGQWIKGLSPAELLDTLLAWKADRKMLEDIAAAIQPRINLLSEAVNWSAHYFNQFPSLTKEQFESKKLSEEQVRQSLQFAIWRLESMFTWNNDTVSQTLMDLASQMEIKLRDFMPAFFIAIAGSTASTPVMQTMVTIGPDLTFARLRHALEIVGGPSKKEAKVWEKLNESLKLPKNDAVDEA
jgi:glutamyl-tRNA synthetase